MLYGRWDASRTIDSESTTVEKHFREEAVLTRWGIQRSQEQGGDESSMHKAAIAGESSDGN
jgi:hypothetical protein